jgi:hypothetical protein
MKSVRPKAGVRVDNLGANVDEWCQKTGNGSSTYDLCVGCAASLASDPHCYDKQLQPYNGDPQGVDGWGDSVDHPPFDDDHYRCTICKVRLREEED